jgi:hypothetical protein
MGWAPKGVLPRWCPPIGFPQVRAPLGGPPKGGPLTRSPRWVSPAVPQCWSYFGVHFRLSTSVGSLRSVLKRGPLGGTPSGGHSAGVPR